MFVSLTNFSTDEKSVKGEGQKVRDTSVCFCRWGNQHAILRAAATTVAELLYAMLLHYTFITMAESRGGIISTLENKKVTKPE